MSTGSLVNVQLILLAMQNRARFMAADDAIRHVRHRAPPLPFFRSGCVCRPPPLFTALLILPVVR